jgi:hypothetical protein
MHSYPLTLSVILCVAVCGCSESDKTSTLTPPPPQQKDNVLFETQLQALDKAKTVEGTLQQDAQNLKESIEKQEAPSQ